MSFQYMPFYTGDYLRDTQHLSCSEHGIYCKFLMHCWDQKGPLPFDERKLCGICNARSGDEIEAMRRVLAEFFIYMEVDKCWYNKRMQDEIANAEFISKKRSEYGKTGAEARRKYKEIQDVIARAKQEPSKSQAFGSNPTPNPNPILDLNPTPTPYPKPKVQDPGLKNLQFSEKDQLPDEKKSSGKKIGKRLPENWVLPKTWGEWALGERPDLTADAVRKISERFRDYWIAKPGQNACKLDWEATWRNWIRATDKLPTGPMNKYQAAEDATREAGRIFCERLKAKTEKDITDDAERI